MARPQSNREGLGRDATWYKSGVFYEVHVRAFYDANGDGAGDFRGLTQKLDYIKGLGVTAIWLLPFYPSPLKDDGYDIADYCDVHPMFGTLGDFKAFLRAAHRRGLRVITELVLNHTSDQHPWFQRARNAKPGSRWRNFYVWSDNPATYKGTRVIFKDVENCQLDVGPFGQGVFLASFFSHQPDLNFDNLEVHEKIIKVVDFWLDLGVDGLRLDAVPYLYEREGTSCENLPETHAFLKKLRAHVDANYTDRMLLAEANQSPTMVGLRAALAPNRAACRSECDSERQILPASGRAPGAGCAPAAPLERARRSRQRPRVRIRDRRRMDFLIHQRVEAAPIMLPGFLPGICVAHRVRPCGR